MRITKALAPLLLFLPLSSLDNAWAAATLDPHDDIRATENDQCAPTLRQRELQRVSTRELPVPDALLEYVPRFSDFGASLASPRWVAIPVTVVPCLLYLFMSLQR